MLPFLVTPCLVVAVQPCMERIPIKKKKKKKKIPKEYDHCKKVVKKYFNKNLIMSAKDKERFQFSNSGWIYNKLFDDGDDKVRGHCHGKI